MRFLIFVNFESSQHVTYIMYSGQPHVAQILGNARQHLSGGLCLMTRGLRQSEEPFERGIQKKGARVCTDFRNALV